MFLCIPLTSLFILVSKRTKNYFWSVRYSLLAGLFSAFLAVMMRLTVQTFFSLEYFFPESLLWFLLLDWVIPGSVFISAFIFLDKTRKSEALKNVSGVEAFLVPFFSVLLWVRYAERVNQLELQDLFFLPAVLVLVLLLVPDIFGVIRSCRYIDITRRMIVCLSAVLLFFAGVLVQTLDHMNRSLLAFIIFIFLVIIFSALKIYRKKFGRYEDSDSGIGKTVS